MMFGVPARPPPRAPAVIVRYTDFSFLRSFAPNSMNRIPLRLVPSPSR
jgi:hypothetical protein